jgi:hypothetical protein
VQRQRNLTCVFRLRVRVPEKKFSGGDPHCVFMGMWSEFMTCMHAKSFNTFDCYVNLELIFRKKNYISYVLDDFASTHVLNLQ